MLDLAIVIPAYKKKYFEKALLSLSGQSNKDFTVYIGDDNSPEDLKSICDKFSSDLDIRYTRFGNNIGAKKLVYQWQRCVELTKGEKWIWLFSDDDIADLNCVEVFYKTIELDHSRFDVYRFNTRVINDNGELIGESIESPFIDTSENMAYEILMGRRGNSMPDHIFARENYLQNGGFVYTDFAQAADWATSILLSKKKGICSMKNAKVNWRIGATNISGSAKKNKVEMLKGHLQFSEWIIKHFEYLKMNTDTSLSYEKIKRAVEFSLIKVINEHYKGLSLRNLFDIYVIYCKLNDSKFQAVKSTANLYLQRELEL